MQYKLEDLIDVSLLQRTLDSLNEIYPFPSALIDNDGKILVAVNWQEACTIFHRKNPLSEKECIKSDHYIIEHLGEAQPFITYKCAHGLIDSALPVIIDNVHLGNFFTGQFFFEKPDLEFFKMQAEKYNFQKDNYLEAINKVPIWSPEKLNLYLAFIKDFVEMITCTGLKCLKERQLSESQQEANKRNQQTIQCISDWIWEVDAHGIYTLCTSNVEKILGYSPQEMIGKSPFDFMPPEEAENTRKMFNEIAKEGLPIVDLENWNLHKDGSLVCLRTNGFPIYDSEGKMIGYRGADKDITERILSETKIKESENALKKAQEIAKLSTWEYNVVTGKNTWSENAYAWYGLSPYEIEPTFEYFRNRVHPEDRHIIDNCFVELEQKKEALTCVLRITFPDGSYKWVQNNIVPVFEGGKLVALNGVNIDITERKEKEMALLEKEQQYKIILQTAIEGFWILDLNGNILEVNDSYAKMLGYTKEELLKMNVKDIESEESENEVTEHMRKVKLFGYDRFHARHKCKSGSIIDLICSVQFRPAQGQFFAFYHDITEILKKENELLKKTNELSILNGYFVGRELKMIELKKEINTLLNQMGLENKYEVG